MTQPQVKPQARVQIYEGMSVETVKKNGSDGQKLMAPLFDSNGDGVYSKQEAEYFNSYNFKSEYGKITLFRNNDDGSQKVTEIKYDNFEKDVLDMYEGKPLNALHRFSFENNKGERCFFARTASLTKVVIDMIKGKVHVEGGKDGNIYANNIELTVKNSDLEKISTTNSKINLQNVKDEGLLWDSATEVKTDGKSIINADADSKIEIVPKEE